MLPGASTPKVSWVSFPIAPIGVIDVRPVELMAMRQKTKTRTRATMLSQISTPKKLWAMSDHYRADERDADQGGHPERQLDVPSTSVVSPRRLNSLLKAPIEDLRLGEERQQRGHGHHRHAAPQRPERDLAEADHALAFGGCRPAGS